MVREFSVIQSTVVDHKGLFRKRAKNGGHRWIYFAESAVRCFTPVMEIKPNRDSPLWNFYADIQLITGMFWLQLWMLQLWMLKKFSEPRVSLNNGTKVVGKWRKYDNLQRGRTDGIVSTRCVPCVCNVASCYSLCYGNVAGWLCTCFNELFVIAHVDDILNIDSNK